MAPKLYELKNIDGEIITTEAGLSKRSAIRCAIDNDVSLAGIDLRNMDLSGQDFEGGDFRNADFRGATLANLDLGGCQIKGAKFDLEGVPKIPDIHKRVYEAASQPGALDMSEWHTCSTTHCRAGWVTHLAPGGTDLEIELGTDAAAALIYLASDPDLERIPSWYETNEKALQDMKRLAENEH